MTYRDLSDVCEIEVAYYNEKNGNLITPSALAWKIKDYEDAVSESNQLAIVAENKDKVIGVLVYSRPQEDEYFDIIRMVANPLVEVDYNIRKNLLGWIVNFSKEDIKRKKLRLLVDGDDIETMKFMEHIKWPHKRTRDKNDSYLYSWDCSKD